MEYLLLYIYVYIMFPFIDYFASEKIKPKPKPTLYVNYTIGNSVVNLNQNETSDYEFIDRKGGFSMMLSINETNHFIGVRMDPPWGTSSGFIYSYFYNFPNKSFLRFGLYLGKGAMTIDNRINYKIGDYIVETNIGNYPSQLALISRDPNDIYYKQKQNFHEITPSISYEYPIFENGYYLAGEIFYSYKKFSQKNKIELFDTLLLNGNEVGFQFGVSRRL